MRADPLLKISDDLVAALEPLSFSPPVAYVYNPLQYAREAHAEYLRRYGRGRPEILLLGMNPGPWGMAQTGVPFGTVSLVRDWLGIEVAVNKPALEHPKRRIEGFACRREEVSGSRLWGWAKETFGRPEKFFSRFFVGNYCPLQFLATSGANLVPEKLLASERRAVEEVCDQSLRRLVQCLEVERVIGVGVFAEKKARGALDGMGLTFGRILHPSPASPAANRGWAEAAQRQLEEQGIML
jgi:single-strand selective monofunctional uracil DNA glycosylase